MSPWVGTVVMDIPHIFRMLLEFIESDDSIVLVGDECLFVGTLVANVLNPKTVMGQEIIWYGKHGRETLLAFEAWCKTKKADIIIMSSLANDKEMAIRRLYKKYGYKPMETVYIKTGGS